MRRIKRLIPALLAWTALAWPPVHAQEFALGAAVTVAADGPVSITVLANHPIAFPDDYVVNALFKAAAAPNVSEGVHAVSAFNSANHVGERNVLPGMPIDAQRSSYERFPRGTPLVFQLVSYFPRAVPRFASVSTADPAGLTAFVNPGTSRMNAPRAAVRPHGEDAVEIAFPGPYGTPDSFDEYPVRIRVSNARVE